MTDTLIDDLRRLDPLPANAETPPVSTLLQRLDPDERRAPTTPRAARLRRPARQRRLAFTAAAVAGASIAAALALSDMGGGGVNVASAAYRATAAGEGVLHMTIVTERTEGATTNTSSRQLWTAQDPRRMRIVQSDPEETRESALTTTPVRVREWSSSQPTVVNESTPTGVDLTESSPVQVIHRLLGEGRATVIGKITYEHQDAWQLQIHPEKPPGSFEGAQLPDPTLIVAASTYTPLELLDRFVTSDNGKPELTVQRERYVTYEELPGNAQNEGLLGLASHPGTSIHVER